MASPSTPPTSSTWWSYTELVVDLLFPIALVALLLQERQVSTRGLMAFMGFFVLLAASRCASRWFTARKAPPEARGQLRRVAIISTVFAGTTILVMLLFLVTKLAP